MTIAIALAGQACANPPAALPALQDGQIVTIEGVTERLQPVINASHKGARVYYSGVCAIDGMFETMTFPGVRMRPVPRGKTGIAAIRAMFPPGTEIEERPGVFAIRLGAVPDAMLRIRINRFALTEQEQYHPNLAVMAIDRSIDVQNGLLSLGYRLPLADMSILVGQPQDGAPHLPPVLTGVTLDQALDQAAQAFGGTVFFGVCEDRRLYVFTIQGGYDWTRPHRRRIHRND